MKKVNKIISLVLAALMLVAVAGCSGNSLPKSISLGSSLDNAWSYKYGDNELASGVYINFLKLAYSDASQKVEDASAEVNADTKIKDDDGKETTVGAYAENRAQMYCKKYFALIDELKALDKMPAEKEISQYVKDYVDQIVSYYSYYYSAYYGSTYTADNVYSEASAYGVSKASYDTSVTFDLFYDTLFKAMYGKEGTKAVSDADLEKHFKDNYTHYRYVFASYTTTDSDGETQDLDGDTKKAYKDSFEKAAKGTSSAETFEAGVVEYMKEFDITSDPTMSRTEKLDDSTADEKIIEKVKGLENNKATTLEAEDGSGIYLIFKGDIAEYVDFLVEETSDTATDEDTTEDTAEDTTEDATEDATEDIAEDATEDATDDTAEDAAESTDSEVDTDTEEAAEKEYKVNEVKSNLTRDTILYDLKQDEFDDYLEESAKKIDSKIEANDSEIKKYTAEMFVTSTES